MHCLGDFEDKSEPDIVVVSRSQTLVFAQGRYRLQYKALILQAITPCKNKQSGHARLTLSFSLSLHQTDSAHVQITQTEDIPGGVS